MSSCIYMRICFTCVYVYMYTYIQVGMLPVGTSSIGPLPVTGGPLPVGPSSVNNLPTKEDDDDDDDDDDLFNQGIHSSINFYVHMHILQNIFSCLSLPMYI
jgi:hypothetical protein